MLLLLHLGECVGGERRGEQLEQAEASLLPLYMLEDIRQVAGMEALDELEQILRGIALE
jgi:hypothetical protein